MKKKTEKWWWDVTISFLIAGLFTACTIHDYYIKDYGNAVLMGIVTGFIACFSLFLCYRRYKNMVADIDAEERYRDAKINWHPPYDNWGNIN